MSPDYFKFIRYHDKRLILILYLVLFMLLGFYWKNNGYSLTRQDTWLISGIVAIVFFNLICELKAWWMYKYVLKSIDFEFFTGKRCSTIEKIASTPLAGGFIAYFITWLTIQAAFFVSEKLESVFGLLLLLPLFLYLIYRRLRICYIKQVIMQEEHNTRYKTLYQALSHYILLSLALNVLTISPLKKNADFSLNEGWLSARLIIAMFILCAIVLAIDLIFSCRSRRYVLLGKLFLKEIEITSPAAVPCASLYAKPVVLRILFLLIVQFAWILLLNVVLTLLEWNLPFEVYYLFCFFPAGGYYCLHLCWLWRTDYLAACDMYLRCNVISKRSGFW